MTMPLVGVIFRLGVWHCVHCVGFISRATSSSPLSGMRYVSADGQKTSPSASALCKTNTTGLALTGMWQA